MEFNFLIRMASDDGYQADIELAALSPQEAEREARNILCGSADFLETNWRTIKLEKLT